MRVRILWLVVLAIGSQPSGAGDVVHDCLPDGSLAMRVTINGSADKSMALPATLKGGLEIPLTLFDASSGNLLWSASAQGHTRQRFAHLDAPVTASMTAIDMDADGREDRLYVGDMSGRLWRFDLHHGAAASAWATATMLADFTNDEGRGFVAAADLSLVVLPGAVPQLQIAIGTAAPGNPRANNRFYVLRDDASPVALTQHERDHWKPLTEADLVRRENVAGEPDSVEPQSAGWYVELGTGHVLVPALTVQHRVVAIIASALPDGGTCEVFARTISLEPLERKQKSDASEWLAGTPLPKPVRTDEGFMLTTVSMAATACSVGTQRVAACDVDTSPRKTWWRRSDAE